MSSFELRVELPTHSYSFRVQVQPEWSIRDVKDEIKRVCPGSPNIDGQRVIWRGRLLRDEEKVRDVWKSADDARTIHLSIHPSAWTGTAPATPQAPTPHVVPQSSQVPVRQTVRRQGYTDLPQPVATIPLYIVKKHTDALHVLTHGHLPSSTSEAPERPVIRSQAVGAVQAAGWSWPAILDEQYPPPTESTEGVRYEQVTIESQHFLKLAAPNATPTPIQQHALKVLSYTFPLLSVSLYPPSVWQPMSPYNVSYPFTPPTLNLNQHLQQLGFPPLRLAPHQNPNQNPNDPNVAIAAEIRAIPLRALLMPLMMLLVRTFILMYFFSPSKRPLFGILLSLWIIYETWGALRAVIGNDRPADAFGARGDAGGAGPANNQMRPARGQPHGARGGDGGNHAATRRPSDILLDYFANMNLRREDGVLSADAPAPEPSLFHKAKSFVTLFVTSLHPAVWDRRRIALRRREGRLRTEAAAREAAPPSEGESSNDSESGNAQDAGRAQARAQLVARHERRPAWVRSYVERVQNAEWVDDA